MNKKHLKARAEYLCGEGLSQKKVAEVLNKEGFRTVRGAEFSQSSVSCLLRGRAGVRRSRKTTEKTDSTFSLAERLGMARVVIESNTLSVAQKKALLKTVFA